MRLVRKREMILGCAAAAGLVALSACEPCAGVVACATAPRVSVQGRIVDAMSGRPVSQTFIALVRTDDLSRDSVATTTDAQGNYEVQMNAEMGKFDVVVGPPALPAYRVRDLSLESTTSTGEGHVLGVWVATPMLNVAVEFFYRAQPSQPVEGAVIGFHPTGGPKLSSSTDVLAMTGPDGRTVLLPGVTAAGVEDVTGQLNAELPNGLGVSVLRDFHLKPDYVFRPQTVHRIEVGPTLAWFSAIYDRATVARVPGTTVTFTRTGGIPVTPTTFTAVTNEAGEFVFPLVPLAAGTVIGDLSIQPPPPFHTYVRTGLQIPTFDSDNRQFFAQFGVGPHLPWAGTVECNGRPLQGATIFLVRVGGIAAEPNQFYSTSDADGHFRMIFTPREYGTLIVDLEFTPPPGSDCIGLVQHNVPMPTLDFDSDLRFLSTWVLPHK
jgi:hypothetical protein